MAVCEQFPELKSKDGARQAKCGLWPGVFVDKGSGL